MYWYALLRSNPSIQSHCFNLAVFERSARGLHPCQSLRGSCARKASRWADWPRHVCYVRGLRPRTSKPRCASGRRKRYLCFSQPWGAPRFLRSRRNDWRVAGSRKWLIQKEQHQHLYSDSNDYTLSAVYPSVIIKSYFMEFGRCDLYWVRSEGWARGLISIYI